MILFDIAADNRLTVIREKPFKYEKTEIQKLFELNLQAITGLEMVRSEFPIKNKRIDTLAFDPQNKAFVIIEYKRERNTNVFDQGITYLNLLLQNREAFIVEYNESLDRNLKRADVDWTQSRVVFVAPDFTENQIEATNFKDLSIDLWKVRRYANKTLAVIPIIKSKTAESFKHLAGNDPGEALKTVIQEIRTYTEEDLLKGKSEQAAELYARFREAILNLTDDIEVKPQKHYVAFKKEGRNIADIEIQSATLKLFVNLKQGALDDPKHLTRDVSQVGHHGNGDYAVKISGDEHLEYIMSLVKQAL